MLRMCTEGSFVTPERSGEGGILWSRQALLGAEAQLQSWAFNPPPLWLRVPRVDWDRISSPLKGIPGFLQIEIPRRYWKARTHFLQPVPAAKYNKLWRTLGWEARADDRQVRMCPLSQKIPA